MVELSKSPILGVFVGTGLTLLIQASSQLSVSYRTYIRKWLIDLQGALPVLFGDNIGTTYHYSHHCFSWSQYRFKRVAGAHVAFNVIGTRLSALSSLFFHWLDSMV